MLESKGFKTGGSNRKCEQSYHIAAAQDSAYHSMKSPLAAYVLRAHTAGTLMLVHACA